MKRVVFVSFLVLLAAGCTKNPTSTSVNPDSSSKVAQLSKESAKTASAQNRVELLNAGTEPKQQLRFTPAANAKQKLQMTMNMDMAMSVAGQTQRGFNSPPIEMTIESQVTKVDANGDIYANFSYSDAKVAAGANTSPEVVEAMRSQIQKLVGLSGSIVVDNQGNTKQASFNIPQDLDPTTKQMVSQMVNSLKQLTSPVPTEAVGVGAKWQVPNEAAVNGMKLNQTATYELVDLKDNVATLQANIEQQAEPQKINSPALPAGASLDLTSLKSQGNGKITVALNQVMPIRSTMSVRSNTQMSVKEANNEKATPMDMKVNIDLNLDSK
jgi:hypothetical protein